MKEDNRAGTYQLISWENRHVSGDVNYLLGAEASGFLHYSEDGYMFVHIMAANRKAYSDGALFGGETSEIVEGANSHISYCGTYRVENHDVIHSVCISSFPNWIHTEQRRRFEFKGGKLILSVQGVKIRDERVAAYLIWKPLNQPGIL